MTPTEKAMEYARQHLQAVRVCWLDRHVSVCGAIEAVELCTNPETASAIIGFVTHDKDMRNLLEGLIDGY